MYLAYNIKNGSGEDYNKSNPFWTQLRSSGNDDMDTHV